METKRTQAGQVGSIKPPEWRAAAATGDRTKAAEHYAKLIDLAKNADVERPEVQEAKAFLASK